MVPATPPVITIDGPSGTGKGTVARLLASDLGFELLDSGVLYRLTALAARRAGVNLVDSRALAAVARDLEVRFETGTDAGEPLIRLHGKDVSDQLRTEDTAAAASQVAAIPAVRGALLERQHSFLQAPGLVADGRDMGTVVFPHAEVKFFLTASAEERAKRRHKQLIRKGTSVSLPALVRDIAARDLRDSTRSVAPLKAAADAHVIDTTKLSVLAVHQQVLQVVRRSLFDEG